ncbi:hypothetical protein ACGFZP_12985 [Kitasatospora sp. NPDC048239]|uniref:hypothetical protein n=1 Tax=Kitasatospora sp. NPDC048239 TaxID=3364046 RepID=UPI003710F40A
MTTNGGASASYVWCFDHGRTHNFSHGAWCTAWWTPLTGNTEAEALTDKTNRFGDAVFYNDLPTDQQIALANAWQDGADHSDCIQPHRTVDGYTDCDGQPL